MRTLMVCAALLGAMLGAQPAWAGDSYKFNLHNRSSEYTITGFYTYEGGRWSKNWIDFTLKPGEEAEMDWGSDAGTRVVPLQGGSKGYDADPFPVAFRPVHNLYMKDQGFTFD